MNEEEEIKEEEYANEYRDGNTFLATKTPVGSNKEEATIREKIMQDAIDNILTIKSEQRQDTCWCNGCELKASVWVREVQFDMKGDKAGVNNSVVSSRDYPGPIPGFCFAHVGSGPQQLAEVVYWDRTEIYLGLRPRKWWVIFTDGTKQGGLCEVLNPKSLKPQTHDLHIKH